MPGFIGHFTYQIDSQGRVSLPAQYRRAIGDAILVMHRSQERCLDLHPPESWAVIEERMMARAVAMSRQRGIKDPRSAIRMHAPNSAEIELDKNGRIRIPPWMQSQIKLENTVVIAGMINRIELWRPDEYEDEQCRLKQQLDEFDAQIFV